MNIDFETMREPGFYQRVQKDIETSNKRINENNGWKEIKNCPVCGTLKEECKRTIYDVVDAHFCEKCGTLFNSSVPTLQNKGHYNIDDIKEALESPDGKKREYRKNTFGLERKALITHFLNKPIQQASLLDVGCNTGFFLELMQPDCKKVVGVEQNKEMCKYVQNELHIESYTSLDGVEGPFDVITIFDVVEHVENPFEMIERAFSLLARGGILVVFTPNWASLAFSALGKNCSQWYPSDHLQFFSEKTVKYIASKLNANLCAELVYYETCGMDIFDMLAYDRDINNIKINKSIFLEKINKIQECINFAQLGNHQRFIIRKV